MQGNIIEEILIPVRKLVKQSSSMTNTGYFNAWSARFSSFSASTSSVQSSQKVTTESAAPEIIVRSSELIAKAQT
jgi:hypothetical protein